MATLRCTKCKFTFPFGGDIGAGLPYSDCCRAITQSVIRYSIYRVIKNDGGIEPLDKVAGPWNCLSHAVMILRRRPDAMNCDILGENDETHKTWWASYVL